MKKYAILLCLLIPVMVIGQLRTIPFPPMIGGTGSTSLTGILVGDGTNPITSVVGGALQYMRRNAGNTAYEFGTPAGAGDMVLADVQTVTGAKTFNDTKLFFRNVANTFNGSFVNTNTADRIYTLKDAAGTLAFTSDITGTNSGTNTGDQTSIVGITGTLAQFNTAISDGNFVSDAITVAGFALSGNVTLADLTATNSTLIFSGAYNGSTARTIGINLSTENTWTGVITNTAATPQIILGVNTTTLGSVKMFGNTSGDATIQPAAVAGTATVITLPNVTSTLLPNTTTSGVAATPTASSTVTVTHNLGRIPTTIRIKSISSFTSNAAATPVPFSYGTWNSTGNRCVYMVINGTTSQVSQTSTAFSIIMVTSAGNQITGVIGNVTSTGFDIVFSETGTHTAGNYLWEAQ